MTQTHKLKTASNLSFPSQPYPSTTSATKNVVVLGGSYGGMHAATVLAQKLPPSHRVILIERNSHFNHLYVFPRFSVLPGHEHKAFIPYSSIFKHAPARPKLAKATTAAQPRLHHKPDVPTPRMTSKTRPKPRGSSNLSAATSSSNMSLEMGGSGTSKDRASSNHCMDQPSLTRGRLSARKSDKRQDSPSRDSLSSNHTATSNSSSSTNSLGSDSNTEADLSSSDTSNEFHDSSSLKRLTNQPVHAAEKAHQREANGRPELQAAELGEALQEGLNLGESGFVQEEDDDDVAEGFQQSAPHIVLQATVTKITSTHVTVTPAQGSEEILGHLGKKKSLWSIDNVSIPYTHLVYALGSHLPDPLRTEARFKKQGVSWMQGIQQRVKSANEIVLVGGGALGIEFATDIASVYPDKQVTLIHSRKQLLPNFDERIHQIAYARLQHLGVNVVLGERLALTDGCPQGSTVKDSVPPLPSSKETKLVESSQDATLHPNSRKLVRTTGGKSVECDLLLLCTGQQPNTSLMASLSPSSVDPSTRLIRVHPTLQVSLPDPRDAAQQPFDAKPPCGDCDCFLDKKAASAVDPHHHTHHTPNYGGRLSNVYAIGDCADAFGALNAGYQAWSMADIVVDNILNDIQGSIPTTTFHPAVNMLKLSLGLGKMVIQGSLVPEQNNNDSEYTRHLNIEIDGKRTGVNGRIVGLPEITVNNDPQDLGVEGVWSFMANADVSDMFV